MYGSKERVRGLPSGLSVICYAVVATNPTIKTFQFFFFFWGIDNKKWRGALFELAKTGSGKYERKGFVFLTCSYWIIFHFSSPAFVIHLKVCLFFLRSENKIWKEGCWRLMWKQALELFFQTYILTLRCQWQKSRDTGFTSYAMFVYPPPPPPSYVCFWTLKFCFSVHHACFLSSLYFRQSGQLHQVFPNPSSELCFQRSNQSSIQAKKDW